MASYKDTPRSWISMQESGPAVALHVWRSALWRFNLWRFAGGGGVVPTLRCFERAFWRRHPDSNRGITDLQSVALPLGYAAQGSEPPRRGLR